MQGNRLIRRLRDLVNLVEKTGSNIFCLDHNVHDLFLVLSADKRKAAGKTGTSDSYKI